MAALSIWSARPWGRLPIQQILNVFGPNAKLYQVDVVIHRLTPCSHSMLYCTLPKIQTVVYRLGRDTRSCQHLDPDLPTIILHLKSPDIGRDLRGRHLSLYRLIRDIAAEHGITCVEQRRDADLTIGARRVGDDRFDDGNLHIVDDRSINAPNVLNAAEAYLPDFWHLDPVGTKAFSSIAGLSYRPGAVDRDRAARFHKTLWDRYVAPRKSRNDQPETVTTVPNNTLAVFCQGDYPIKSGATLVTDLRMVDIVCAHSGDRPIYVKPHPVSSTPEDIAALHAVAARESRVTVGDANIHDLLADAACTVSINSTVALEGFIHGTPAILLGQSDFHHVAGRVRTSDDFATQLDAQLAARTDYVPFLAWYFLKHCLGLRGRNPQDRIWQKFAQVGFPLQRFLDG